MVRLYPTQMAFQFLSLAHRRPPHLRPRSACPALLKLHVEGLCQTLHGLDINHAGQQSGIEGRRDEHDVWSILLKSGNGSQGRMQSLKYSKMMLKVVWRFRESFQDVIETVAGCCCSAGYCQDASNNRERIAHSQRECVSFWGRELSWTTFATGFSTIGENFVDFSMLTLSS